ncbi:MAG: hypothetical protein U0165_14315 [Polyangiaceae bacterium]
MTLVTTAMVLSISVASADKPTKKKSPSVSSRVVSTSFADLPRADIPPMLEDAKAPREIKAGQPSSSDVVITAGSPTDQSKIKKAQSDRSPGADYSAGFSVKLSVSSGVISAHRNGQGYNASSMLWTMCGVGRSVYNARPIAVRWETAKVTKGSLELTITDAWYDPHSCIVSEVKNTVLHPKVMATVNDTSAVWALRSGAEEITVLMPWSSLTSVDGGTSSPKVEVGLLTRVVLPAKRGSSAAVAVSYANDYSFRQWSTVVASGGLASVTSAIQAASLSIDVVQTISDPAPSITTRVQGETNDIRGDAFFERLNA